MQIYINWDDPFLPNALDITTADLDEFYTAASETDRMNLFFVLLSTFHAHEADPETAAHLCFLMAYYLFVPLTPPGSQMLALRCIRRALELNPTDEYKTLEAFIEKGN